MPTRTKPEDILEKVEWVKRLPDNGGLWGKGLIETAQAVADEIFHLEKKKAEIEEQIRKRLRVMRAMPARAEREAPLLYSDFEVEKAHTPVFTYEEEQQQE